MAAACDIVISLVFVVALLRATDRHKPDGSYSRSNIIVSRLLAMSLGRYRLSRWDSLPLFADLGVDARDCVSHSSSRRGLSVSHSIWNLLRSLRICCSLLYQLEVRSRNGGGLCQVNQITSRLQVTFLTPVPPVALTRHCAEVSLTLSVLSIKSLTQTSPESVSNFSDVCPAVVIR